jgi:hypothetical protein
MAFPKTLDELREAGYKFEDDSECRSCGAAVEWWKTPRGKMMPFDHGTAISHFSTCPNADQHRKPEPSKITTATLDMDWLREQARGCHCTVCKKITGR